MTQNTEQNVRTRDAQITSYPKDAYIGQYSGKTWVPALDEDDLDPDRLVEGPVRYVRCDIADRQQKEAEARGAEEQRWKDAEARDTPSAYVRPDDFYNDEGDERCGPWSGDQIGKYTLPLYTHPANVAALETLVDSLKEAEQLARADAEASKARGMTLEADAARFVWLIENGGCFWYGIPGFAPVSGRTTEDRVKDLLSAIDKNMARAALTREGGV